MSEWSVWILIGLCQVLFGGWMFWLGRKTGRETAAKVLLDAFLNQKEATHE